MTPKPFLSLGAICLSWDFFHSPFLYGGGDDGMRMLEELRSSGLGRQGRPVNKGSAMECRIERVFKYLYEIRA